MESNWELIKKVYEDNFNINGHVIDYVAVRDILLQCVSGLSNEKIGHSLNFDVVYIQHTIYNFLGFNGWKYDLDLSPWRIYCLSAGSKLAFEKRVKDLTNMLDYDTIVLTYRVCSIYESIRKEIENFYERS